MVIHSFMGKNKEGFMVIRAFVSLMKVGRQPFAAGQSVSACRLQTPPVGMGMPTYKTGISRVRAV